MYGVIYKLTAPNNKIYIGQAKDYKKRMAEHGRTKKYIKRKLACSIHKYKWINFKHEIIDTAETFAELNEKETYYINLFDSFLNGLNHNTGGVGKRPLNNPNVNKIISIKNKIAWKKKLADGWISPLKNSKLTNDHKIKLKNNHASKTDPEKWHNDQSKRSKGSSNGNAKLTEELAKHILSTYIVKPGYLRELSIKYNISNSAIQALIYRRTWKHL